MNEFAYNVTSIRQLLPQSSPGYSRRRRVGGAIELRDADLDSFNCILSTVGWSHAPLSPDQIATAARMLFRDVGPYATPRYIQRQLDRGAVLSQMVADQGWDPANDAIETARSVTAYLAGHRGLIPNWLPGMGRLDDAVVIEAAWPRLAAEVHDFQDYCRLRGVEAAMRGADVADFSFSRADWVAAGRAEAKLRAQQRVLRQRFHLSAPLSLFRVH